MSRANDTRPTPRRTARYLLVALLLHALALGGLLSRAPQAPRALQVVTRNPRSAAPIRFLGGHANSSTEAVSIASDTDGSAASPTPAKLAPRPRTARAVAPTTVVAPAAHGAPAGVPDAVAQTVSTVESGTGAGTGARAGDAPSAGARLAPGPLRPPDLDALFSSEAIARVARGGELAQGGPGGALEGGPVGGGALGDPEPGAPPRTLRERWEALGEGMEPAGAGDRTGRLQAFEERLTQWFQPPDEALVEAAPWGLGAVSVVQSYLEFYTSGRAATPSNAMATLFAGPSRLPTMKADRGNTDKVPLICVIGCSDMSHAVSVLAALIDVDHSDEGVPTAWRVAISSDDDDFDKEALEAVKAAAALTPPAGLRLGTRLATTRWLFEATASRWGRGELLLDPLFEPAGRTIESESGVLGETRVTKRVALVLVRYR